MARSRASSTWLPARRGCAGASASSTRPWPAPAPSSTCRRTSPTRRSTRARTTSSRASSCAAARSRSWSTSTCPWSRTSPRRSSGSTTSTARPEPGRQWPSSADLDRERPNRVVAVAEPVPLRPLRLASPREVGRARPKRDRAGPVDAHDQLPPLPPVGPALADEARLLPGSVVEAHLDPGNRRGARPGHPANDEVADLDRLVGMRLGDQAAHTLERHRLPDKLAASFPLVLVLVGLEVAVERALDQLDLGQPLHRGHRVPAGDDEPRRIPMLDRERLAVHRICQQGV